MIRFETSLGDFTIELFEKEAPESVANFAAYVEEELRPIEEALEAHVR